MYPVGSILDLQTGLQSIPLVLAILYGGYTAGIVVILISSMVKFVMYGSFYGLDSLSYQFAFFHPISVLPEMASIYEAEKADVWSAYRFIQRILYLHWTICVSLMNTARPFYHKEKLLELFFSTLYYIFFLVLSIYSIEFVKENAQMRTQLVQSEKADHCK
ncbi:hypothetical protein ACEQPO_23620 [Bacillus sp. SL00103]